MEAFAVQLGWKKKASRKLTDALYTAAAQLPVALRVAAANAATTTLVEDAFGEATPLQPDDTEEAIQNLAFVAANLFPAATATQEAVDQLLSSVGALVARVSVSQGRASEPVVVTRVEPSPAAVRPTTTFTTASAVTDATAARSTRPRCPVCRFTLDSCTCHAANAQPGGAQRGSGAPLTRQPPAHHNREPPPPPPPAQPRQPTLEDDNSNHSDSTSHPASERTTDTDARTSKTTTSRGNRRPGTFKDPAVLWEPELWNAEILDGGSARDLERELLHASGADSLPHDSFPRELCEALAQICAEWAQHAESQLVPELVLELLFRQKLWTTPGADKAAVDQAMRRVRAQSLLCCVGCLPGLCFESGCGFPEFFRLQANRDEQSV